MLRAIYSPPRNLDYIGVHDPSACESMFQNANLYTVGQTKFSSYMPTMPGPAPLRMVPGSRPFYSNFSPLTMRIFMNLTYLPSFFSVNPRARDLLAFFPAHMLPLKVLCPCK